eukprot:CAMPEP_0202773124 /NCGR_PEP_ID=MMETSP1388-20130828/43986_1 /ASSEMBLY_ACC=CAM_ASM_000864 /TAXON_ID=37098 /ORGANISM="Isochrysis sp, Strain CCMP1244" /LENGTH=98 /DNA_ID=CAMNT_0049442137 /DNA_START=102 /DNA_END=395 /DNA_ORIENTATION=+
MRAVTTARRLVAWRSSLGVASSVRAAGSGALLGPMGSEAARPIPTPLADGDADDSTFGVPAQHGLGSPRGLALMTIAAAGQPGGPSAQLLAACGSAAA